MDKILLGILIGIIACILYVFILERLMTKGKIND